ncbi:zinc finger, CCHC-type containing protein [Tanacetum coccineum]
MAQQPKPELRKSKRNRILKNFGSKFQLYLIEGTKDEISNQHSYCFNVEDDPKTFDEAMKSRDIALWKEAIKDEMDSILGNNTWVLADLPPGCKPLGRNWIFQTKLKVDGTIKKFKARLVIQVFRQNSQSDYSSDGYEDSFLECKFDKSGKGVIICLYVDDMLIFGTDKVQSHYIEKVLKKFNYFDCTPVSTPMDTSEKLMPNNGQSVSQLEYYRVIGCLMYAMTCKRPNIAFVMGKLSRYTSNPRTQHWQAIQRVLKYLKKTMDFSLTYTSYPSVLEG